MFKRIIKIILILLAIFLIIIGIIWLIGRHTAQKNGTQVLSFKQFVGLSSKESTSGTAGTGGSLSSTFTGSGSNSSGTSNDGSSGAGGTGNYGSGNDGAYGVVNTSTFTDGGISPTGNTDTSGSDSGSTSGSGDTNTSGNTNGNSSGDTNSTGNTGTAAPTCGTADTNITFTPDEIAELNALQNRFYSLAQTLHTDGDVASELANHDTFALKAAQATELYNYCEALIPSITDQSLQQRVATPFWDAWNVSDTPSNQWGNGSTQTDSQSLINYVPGSGTYDYLTQLHDGTLVSPELKGVAIPNNPNPDSSGISGPYGQYNFSNPQYVIINGSLLGYSSNQPQTTAVPLAPVVEHILRVNLW